ncbi:translation initiation factor IF-1A [Candidatus Woesearchaeota archaeon]|nr:translation initiation factor IF-1A [Nanoarchaeota archaeon]MCB9370075.1 translation initiation factor IF-1A [Candidatus Woesearchaeota archaeon]USN44606.1 MAG: translation initiation factor IF-1A [Candidatus Woesearchaeota archaeon]
MVDTKKKKLSDLQNEAPAKVRFPVKDEFVGIVEKRLGGSRMHVRSSDGREILARVPGRVKKFLWIREGDIVLLQPWELDKERADLVYKYKPGEIKALEQKGLLGNFENVEEF